ncbi:MAG: DUF4386 family protein [Kineosporiaceae bacterium]
MSVAHALPADQVSPDTDNPGTAPSPASTDVARTVLASTAAAVALGLVGSIGLAVSFGWPAVLDAPAAEALPAFAEQRGAVAAFFLVQLAGSLALSPAVLGLHRLAAARRPAGPGLQALTALGVAALVVQCLGWVRWPIAVPHLADAYLDPAASPAAREATAASYEVLNAYAGGALGEHLGWLLQAVWAVGIAAVLVRRRVLPRAVAVALLGLAVAWAATLVPAGWFAADELETVGVNVYSVWLLGLLAAAGVLVRRRNA